MIILSIKDLQLAFGTNTLFENINFEVNEGDKIGFIGMNGSGKTTLFNLITGGKEPENGEIVKSSKLNIGYLHQHLEHNPEISVYDETRSVFFEIEKIENRLIEINSKIDLLGEKIYQNLLHEQMELREYFEREGGLTYKNRTKSTLIGLGFTAGDLEKKVKVLSGGEKSKLGLAKLLLSNSNLLLLDEPTNHLDIAALAWLEDFLRDYKGSIIVISHDRYFLDRVTNKTMELENRKLISYIGSYSEFVKKKEAALEAAQKKYELMTAEIKRIEGIIEQQKRFGQKHNFITIAHKQKSIDRLEEKLEKPEKPPETLKFKFKCKNDTGNDVLLLKSLSLTLGGRLLFREANIDIKRKERVFLIGANGSGKSSLIKIIKNEYPSNNGIVKFGARVEPGYYDQGMEYLDNNKNVINQIWDEFPKMTETEVRTALGQFLFTGDNVFKKTELLSGGEKARISLLLLMLRGSNLLFLDEPTNHLDIFSRQALEGALNSFPGTLFIISHDRYLVNKLATKIYELSDNTIKEYCGNYDYYLLCKENFQNPAYKNTIQKPVNDYKLKKELESEKRKLASKLSKIEKSISEFEIDKKKLEEDLLNPEISTDYITITEITEKLSLIDGNINDLMDEWEKLQKY